MLKKFLLTTGLLVGLTGCATTQGPSAADLQMRVTDLEKQVESKDAEIKDLKYTLKDVTYELDRMKAGGRSAVSKGSYAKNDEILRVNVSPERLQKSLKAAGYYNGAIDGKLGNRTKAAVSKFQRDNGLNGDGIVGEKTWALLKAHSAE